MHTNESEARGPLWQQIERTMLSEIGASIYAPGSQLPNELELAKRFSVNRHTVRRAMAALAQRGAIRIEQGRGSFVQDNLIHYEVGARTRVEENLIRQHRGFSGRLLGDFEMPATAEIARELHIAVGDRVDVLDTLNESDGVPFSIVRTYLPSSRFAGFANHYRAAHNSMTAAFELCGVPDFSRHSTDIATRLPTAEESTHLKQSPTVPVIVCRTVDVDAAGTPIKFGMARFAGDRVTLHVRQE